MEERHKIFTMGDDGKWYWKEVSEKAQEYLDQSSLKMFQDGLKVYSNVKPDEFIYFPPPFKKDKEL